MVKVQVLETSKISPLIFIVVSEGTTFEYTLMEDTAPEVLREMKKAAHLRATVILDVNDVRSTHRVGVR